MAAAITRRTLLAGTAVGLVSASQAVASTGQAEVGPQAAEVAEGTYSWEYPPTPIDEALVTEEMECEVCVVGAGNAGVVAALTAVEEGADVVVIQKHDDVVTQGTGHNCVNSKLQDSLGIVTDQFLGDAVRQWQADSAQQCDNEQLRVWIEQSGEMDDWINEHLEGSGIFEMMTYDPLWNQSPAYLAWVPVTGGYANEDPTGEVGAIAAMKVLARQAQDQGARFIFNCTGERLEREDGGRVTAVLGKREDGTYLRVKASKGIILCAGGYDSNMEMRAKYLPHSRDFPACSDNFGEGMLMAMWVGAKIPDAPHCSNLHFDIFPVSPTTAWGSAMPWLRVNSDGKRVGNEDVAYHWIALQCGLQKDGWTYQIFDSDFDQYYHYICDGKGGLFKTVPDMSTVRAAYEPVLQEAGWDTSNMTNLEVTHEGCVLGGSAYKADTLEELAVMAGIDPEGLKTTVERYNELYDAGADTDCFKSFGCMTAVRTPPFYCIPRRPYVLGTLSGVMVNTSMEVLDTDGNPIPGLYAAGNNSGGLFGGLVQSMALPALTIGRAHTFGRVAAKHCVADN